MFTKILQGLRKTKKVETEKKAEAEKQVEINKDLLKIDIYSLDGEKIVRTIHNITEINSNIRNFPGYTLFYTTDEEWAIKIRTSTLVHFVISKE